LYMLSAVVRIHGEVELSNEELEHLNESNSQFPEYRPMVNW